MVLQDKNIIIIIGVIIAIFLIGNQFGLFSTFWKIDVSSPATFGGGSLTGTDTSLTIIATSPGFPYNPSSCDLIMGKQTVTFDIYGPEVQNPYTVIPESYFDKYKTDIEIPAKNIILPTLNAIYEPCSDKSYGGVIKTSDIQATCSLSKGTFSFTESGTGIDKRSINVRCIGSFVAECDPISSCQLSSFTGPIKVTTDFPDKSLECISGETCTGDHLIVCENNVFVNKGQVDGKCGYTSSITQIPNETIPVCSEYCNALTACSGNWQISGTYQYCICDCLTNEIIITNQTQTTQNIQTQNQTQTTQIITTEIEKSWFETYWWVPTLIIIIIVLAFINKRK